MSILIRSVGDRLLARLVPQVDAYAAVCTPWERSSWCTQLHNLCVQNCHWCPGTGYTCTTPICYINAC